MSDASFYAPHGLALTGYADEDGVPCLYDQDEDRSSDLNDIQWDADEAEAHYDGFEDWDEEADDE